MAIRRFLRFWTVLATVGRSANIHQLRTAFIAGLTHQDP